jgi:hypothetical protein
LSGGDQHRRDRSSDGLTSNITVKTEFESAYLFTARFHGIFDALTRGTPELFVNKYTNYGWLERSAGEKVFVVLLSAVVDHGDMKRK